MIALFLDPYLDTLGGGEKYMLDIASVLYRKGYDTCEFLWPHADIKEKLIARFGKNYSFISVNSTWHTKNSLKRALYTKKADTFFYQPDGSYPATLAKKNIALLQVPSMTLIGNDSPISVLKRKRFVLVYNSLFTKRFFNRVDNNKSGHVLYPAVSDDCLIYDEVKKEKIILSVGRFFKHLHAKRQDILIQTFLRAQEKNILFKKYTLVLVGSNDDTKYISELKKKIGKCTSIQLTLDCSRTELLSLYKRASVYWHAAGYGVDEKRNPERVEHFGISPVEAMAAGAVPIAYNAGGLKETIENKKTGFIYESPRELIEHTAYLFENAAIRMTMAQRGVLRAQEKYSRNALEKNLSSLL